MKKCTKCKELKELTEFSKDKSKKDGYCVWCKECASAYKKVYQKTSAGKASQARRDAKYRSTHKEEAKDYRSSNAGKASHAKSQVKYRAKYPLKKKAHDAVKRAIKDGRLPPRPTHCAMCGKECKVELHHPDYSKPLETIPLCHEHHTAVHTDLRIPTI